MTHIPPVDIKVYSTHSCGYCFAAKRLLKARDLPFTEIDCSGNDETRERLMEETGQRTVPQIYLDGVPIGGYSELSELDRSGELAKIVSGQIKPTSIAE